MKPLAQSIAISLKSELSEIENVTEVNGCFLLRAPENKIVESTIPLNINADILWEVCVLRDTFQQFSEGLEHGDLKEITLQGDKGFIFLRKLNREFILLAMAPNTVNLGYFKLAMIDIIDRINQKIDSLQDEEIAEMVQNAIEAEAQSAQISAAPSEIGLAKAAVSDTEPCPPGQIPVSTGKVTVKPAPAKATPSAAKAPVKAVAPADSHSESAAESCHQRLH